jgi:hypothetical protein
MKHLIITSAERRTHSSVLSGETRQGWFIAATVAEMGNPVGLVQLSRFDDEAVWTVDAMFSANGLPQFVNGFGARSLVTQTLAPQFANDVDTYIAAQAEKGMAA